MTEGQRVTHAKFGRGKIRDISDGAVTVQFETYGARSFRYPDAFDGFLAAEDPAFAKQVSEDLQRQWQAQSDEELSRRKRLEQARAEAKTSKIRTR